MPVENKYSIDININAWSSIVFLLHTKNQNNYYENM